METKMLGFSGVFTSLEVQQSAQPRQAYIITILQCFSQNTNILPMGLLAFVNDRKNSADIQPFAEEERVDTLLAMRREKMVTHCGYFISKLAGVISAKKFSIDEVGNIVWFEETDVRMMFIESGSYVIW